MIVLLSLFGIIANGQDYQLSINQSAIEKIKDHFVPLFHEYILTESIPSQTITGTVDVDIDNITVSQILHDEIVINLDSKHQSVTFHMNNIDLLFDTFEFEAYKTIIWKLSCFGYATPEINNWNISFKIDVLHNEICTFSVDLNPASIIVNEGNTWLNTQFDSNACQTLYEVGDFLLDIEDEIHQKIIDEIPVMMEAELQILIDELLEQMQWFQIKNHTFIEVCYQNIHINDNDLYIEADFIFNDTKNNKYYESYPSTTYAMYTKSDDLSLLIGIIVYGIILFVFGICIGSLITCCVCRKKHKSSHEPIPSSECNDSQIEIEQYSLNQNTI